ncbi:MAG: DUF6587 family protein [Steroidobacteraceae bacterium]|jgi:hypothetical protein
MQHFVDIVLVSLVLLTSAAYALFALGPKSLRNRVAASIGGIAARATALPQLRGPLQRLSARLAKKAQGACGGCDSCGSETAANEHAANADVRVPIAKIGMRRGLRHRPRVRH